MATKDGTALVRRDENEQAQQALTVAVERDKMVRAAAAQIAEQAWGKGLSNHERAAVARYALEAGLDPVRHVNVLGGNVYVNAQAYIDVLAATPGYQGVEFQNISADKEQRAAWFVPDKARAAFICRVKLNGDVFEEAGYAPKHGNDKVGEQYPGEKARATALRRAARLAVPIWTERVDRTVGRFDVIYTEARANQAAHHEPEDVSHMLPVPNDPYADEDMPRKTTVTVEELARPVDVPDGPDPYADDADLFAEA